MPFQRCGAVEGEAVIADGPAAVSRGWASKASLDAMFSPTVQLRSGGYIVINQTEALVSIDVNSGRSTPRASHRGHRAQGPISRRPRKSQEQLRLARPRGPDRHRFHRHGRESATTASVERKLFGLPAAGPRARIQVGPYLAFSGCWKCRGQRIRASVAGKFDRGRARNAAGSGHVRSVSSVALQLLRGIEEVLMKGATHNLVVRTRTDVRALCAQSQARPSARFSKTASRLRSRWSPMPPSAACSPLFIDRGEQVHTLEAAESLARGRQAAASPPQIEEAYDDEDPLDIEARIGSRNRRDRGA